ncbi:cyclic nucleotide-binding domain-containing protein [bacterium]|nr:cyclic nucleotide-binding domain-containing protein [bacterium]
MGNSNTEMISCSVCKARALSIFHVCSLDDAAKIDGFKVCQSYKKGQEIFIEGHRPSGVYCINTGKIKLVKLGNEGKEKIVRLSGAGDLIGYKAIVSNNTYSASAVALADTRVCFIPKSDFLGMLSSDGKLSFEFTQLLCRNISDVENEVVDIAYKSVRERLAEALLLLQEKFKFENENPEIINVTREDLATLIGTAKETVIRLLSDFKEEGIVESMGRKIVLKDQDALVRMCSIYD